MSILFAHPVLAPWTADYSDSSSYEIEATESAPANLQSDELSLRVGYRLISELLTRLVEESSAKFGTLVTSPHTMVRRFFPHGLEDGSESVLTMRLSDFSTDILLTPYIVANEDLRLPVTDEHDAEFRDAGLDGFDLSVGTVLAIGDGVKISNRTTALTSIVDIVGSRDLEPGRFELDYEDNRIKVFVNNADLPTLKTMRTGSDTAKRALYPSVYLPAITGALRNLISHPDQAWAPVVWTALERQGYTDVNEDTLNQDAEVIAQELMSNPLGLMLKAFVDAEDSA